MIGRLPILLIGLAGTFGAVTGITCGGDGVGARIVLTPDPDRNSEAQVAAELAVVEWLFDAEGGFAGVDDQGGEVSGFVAADPDEDGQTELILRTDVPSHDRLPVVGLDPGSNQATRIAVRARGLTGTGEVAAYGGVPSQILFVEGGSRLVRVPFNLNRAHLPPRIVAVAPRQLPAGADLASIALYFSGEIDPSTLPDRVRVSLDREAGAGVIVVDGALQGPRECPHGLRMWQFVPSSCQGGHAIEAILVEADEGILDRKGRPLQAFEQNIPVSDFRNFGPCAPRTPCDLLGPGDAERFDLLCNPATSMFEPAPCSLAACPTAPDRFDWVTAASDTECQDWRSGTFLHDGTCVVDQPWPCQDETACDEMGLTCNGGTSQCVPASCSGSCDPGTLLCVAGRGCLPRMGTCAEDCQAYGSCPEFGQECIQLDGDAPVCR